MVPASTLMYGSIFWRVTRNPRASRSAPMEAAAIPLPREETTPPVTKMILIGTSSSFRGAEPLARQRPFLFPGRRCPVEPAVAEAIQEVPDPRAARRAQGEQVVSGQERMHRPRLDEEPLDLAARDGAAREPGPGQALERAASHQGRAGAGRRAPLARERFVERRPVTERRREARQRLPRQGQPLQAALRDLPGRVSEERQEPQRERVEGDGVAPQPLEEM